MEVIEDQIIEKNAKQCKHCARKKLLPYEHEQTCFSCGCNVIKRKNELIKFQRKTLNFINRLENAEKRL